MLHAVEHAIRSAQKLFRGVAVLRISSDTGADRKAGFFLFAGKTFTNSGCHASGNVLLRFGQNQCELVSAIAGRRIDCPRMTAQNFAEADERTAAYEMAVAVVDSFQAVHIQKHNAEGTVRAARAIELRF